MRMKDLVFEKIQHWDPLHSRSDRYGMVSEWVARNEWGNAVAFGRTKAECREDARRYLAAERS